MSDSERMDLDWEEVAAEDIVVVGHSDVRDYNQENILPQSPEALAKIRGWLKPTEYEGEGSEYRKHLSSHLSGTGKWFLDSEAFRCWHDSVDYGLLWARGIPGSGKSVLAASLIHQLSQEQVPVLYFFFRQTIDANHNPSSALRDWLVQILQYSPPLQLHLKEYLGEKNGKNREATVSRVPKGRDFESLSIDDLWQDLRTALMSLSKAYIIVDALDEIVEGQGTTQFLQILSGIAQWHPAKIKVLLTSRPVTSVERLMHKDGILRIRLDEDKVDPDILLYVKHRLDSCSIPREYHRPIQNAVPGNANGLFLYAKLAMDEFCKENVVIQTVLNNLPTSLNIMYSRLLSDHAAKTGIDHEIQVLIMQCITHSIRSLRLIEVAEVIKFAYPSAVKDLKASKALVRSACGPLLDILPDETLCVVHHSLTEFLKGATRTNSDDYPILKESESHFRIAMICLSYLQSGSLDSFSLQIEKQSFRFTNFRGKTSNQLLPPFAKYAAAYWHVHAKRAIPRGAELADLNDMLDKFTTHPDFRKWAYLERFSNAETLTPVYMAASLGLVEYLKAILSRPNTDVQENGPLCFAAKEGHGKIVELLLQHGADSEQYDIQGYSPLHRAAERNHAKIVSTLLESGCNPYILTSPHGTADGFTPRALMGCTPLWYACTFGHVATVAEFLPYIQSVSQATQALIWAVERQKSEVVAKILEHHMTNVQGTPGRRPLCIACASRDLPTIRLLLAAGADPNRGQKPAHYMIDDDEKPRYWRPLHVLAQPDLCSGYLSERNDIDSNIIRECFEVVLKAGAEVNRCGIDFKTPLHVASDETATRMLLAGGADVEAVDKRNETPIHTCASHQVARILISEGKADTEHKCGSGLTALQSSLTTSMNNSMVTIEKSLVLLELGADATVVDEFGTSTIRLAINKYQSSNRINELINQLCQAGADIDFEDIRGVAPIYCADVTKPGFDALVMAGANIKPKNDRSRAALFESVNRTLNRASDHEFSRICDSWLKHGIKLDITDNRGRSLLHSLVSPKGSLGVRFKQLMDLGVDPRATDHDGNTLWHDIVRREAKRSYNPDKGVPESLVELLNMGVDICQANGRGRTPLHVLSTVHPAGIYDYKRSTSWKLGGGQAGTKTIFDFLVNYYTNVDIADEDGITSLHLASTFSEHWTRRLLEVGADPALATCEGNNTLHISARSKAPNIVGLLLEAFQMHPKEISLSAVNARNSFGKTPFYYACSTGSYECARLLIDAGARVDFETYDVSPWRAFAKYEGEREIWSSPERNGLPYGQQLEPDYENRDAGGVLSGDKHRSRIIHEKGDRLYELVDLILSCARPCNGFIRRAIEEAMEANADVTVECLLGIRKLPRLGKEIDVSPELFKRLRKRKFDRIHHDTITCKSCGKDHGVPPHRAQELDIEALQCGDLLPETMRSYSRFGPGMLHHLVSRGLASVLSTIVTLEDTRKIESRSWPGEERKSPPWEPLLLAACRRRSPNMEIVKLLVGEIGVDVNAQHFHSRNVDPSRVCGENNNCGEAPLHALARGEHWWQVAEALPYLLEHGADTEVRDGKGMTPLNAALSRTGWPIFNRRSVETLLKHGAEVNDADIAGRSCLARALHDMDLTRLLLEHGATITHEVFIQIIELQSVDLLKLILLHGGDPNILPSTTKPAILKNLSFSEKALYPLHYLFSRYMYHFENTNKRDEMANTFLEHGANPVACYEGSTILHELIKKNLPIDSIDTVLANSIIFDVDSLDSDGLTPLLVACQAHTTHYSAAATAEGRTLFSRLISRGADLQARDMEGNNILHYPNKLTRYNNRADIEMIITSAPNLVREANSAGKTPLHIAVACLNTIAIDSFISSGADIHARDQAGNTVLHVLFTKEWHLNENGELHGPRLDLFQRLISLGGDINGRNNAGETPAFSFFREGGVSLCSSQLTGKDGFKEIVARRMRRGNLECEAGSGEEAVYDLLTKAGCDWKTTNSEGQNLLHIVAAANRKSFSSPKRSGKSFRALMDMGLDPHQEDKLQRAPVDIAADLGIHPILEIFKAED